MAKAILTFKDTDGGGVKVKLSFHPAAKTNDKATPAQQMAMQAIEHITATSTKKTTEGAKA